MMQIQIQKPAHHILKLARHIPPGAIQTRVLALIAPASSCIGARLNQQSRGEFGKQLRRASREKSTIEELCILISQVMESGLDLLFHHLFLPTLALRVCRKHIDYDIPTY